MMRRLENTGAEPFSHHHAPCSLTHYRSSLLHMSFLGAYAAFVANLRIILFYLGVVAALICAIDWSVRTRRINPFSKVAPFFRGNIDPILARIERMIVRAGGVPSSAA